MKFIRSIIYIIVFFLLMGMIFLEYENYRLVNVKIETSNYEDEIDKLLDNYEQINKYSSILQDDSLAYSTISKCTNYLQKLDILKQSSLDFDDIYELSLMDTSALCSNMSYNKDEYINNIFSKYVHKNTQLHHINLGNKTYISDVFENFLANQISSTSYFIEMLEYIRGEQNVSN